MPTTRNKVYISIGEWQHKKKYAIPYTGYVIGVGYAFVEYKTTTDEYKPDQSRAAYPFLGNAWYNGTASSQSRLFEYRVITEQHLDTSEDAIRDSFPTVANQEDNAPNVARWAREVIATNPLTALEIGRSDHGSNNISTTVVRFQTRDGLKGGWEGEASEQNAFRHVLWQSYITNKYGHQTALDVGNAHEDNPNVDLYQRHFQTRAEADQVIDLLNNQIGRNIGRRAQTGTVMNKMALFVLDQFKSDGLYTGVPQDDGTWYIDRTTITDEQYEQLKAIFESLNHLGRTSEEQKTKDEEAERKRKEAMEALERKWRTIR